MTIEILEKNKCTGCYACYNACPKNCIAMERDHEGFSYPIIDKEKCVECGLCEKACPILHKVVVKTNTTTPDIFAAWSLNDTIRLNSTSGGIFSEIALSFLEKGGYICGARYGEKHHIEHCVANTAEGLEKIRQSKYAQSDIGYVYRDIKKLLDNDQKVLFCGTPCECAGLRNYLRKDYENLTVVDFVCRGSNSPKVYEKFLEYLEEKYQSKVTKVWFKNKTYGWNRFSTKVEFDNGQSYLEDRYHDKYIVGYIRYNLYMRPSCAHCEYKTFPRVSDITLADFWGIKLDNPELDIEKGTSLVMINSLKGKNLYKNIERGIFSERKTFSDAFGGNACISTSPIMNPKRQYFFEHLDTMTFDVLTKKCFKDKWTVQIKQRFIQIIPLKLKNWIKKAIKQ